MSNILVPSSARQSFTTLRLGALENVRALVTTKWDRGYTQRIMTNIESFYVDSSLDNDADSWQIQFGDPTGDYLALLERNNEVRVQMVSSAVGAAGSIFSGIADDIVYDQTGALVMTGRDYSSLALDSTCPPSRYKLVKAKYVVANQARKLGYKNISLSQEGEIKKTIKTDGSETYWEFWYRLYRNEKMWLWVGPDGALIGNKLNYAGDPSYYFGTPQPDDSEIIKEMYVPVETVEIRKSTQGRLGEVWVLVKDGKRTFMVKTGMQDPTMKDWVKQPFKIIQDNISHTVQNARKTGWEEIFEGKVGSLEIRLTVSMPHWVFRTNRIAKLRIPEIGYGGEFFVIGWKMQADSDGWVQEIRLREKYIAMSRRVPHEPTMPVQNRLPKDTLPGHNAPTPTTKDILSALIPSGAHPNWGDFFYKAAAKWSNGWDQDLALASILGVAHIESTITNVRENTGHHDHTEWYKRPTAKDAEIPPIEQVPSLGGNPDPKSLTSMVEEWMDTFANAQADVIARGIYTRELGVGPFQLTSVSLKLEADDYFAEKNGTPTNHSQYDGGRWDPESNIWVGSRFFLQDCVKASGLSPSDGDQQSAMWQGYYFYHHGVNAIKPSELTDDEKKLRQAVLVEPGFLNLVRTTTAAMREASRTAADGNTESSLTSDVLPGDPWPSVYQCLAAFTSGTWAFEGKS